MMRAIRERSILFCRYPVPGRTKTRLIPVLGRAGAAEFQRRLTEEVLIKTKRFSRDHPVEMEVCFEGCSEERMRRWLGPHLLLSRQAPGNLGERMKAAFDSAFQSGCRRVVLHGADIPGLDPSHLEEAFKALHEVDLVLGPSTDGGYWLIGLRAPSDLFSEMTWSVETVLQETLHRANKKKLSVRLLQSLTDIDSPEQLSTALPNQAISSPYVSVIIPALNEERNIESAISTAMAEEAEIIVADGGSEDGTASKALAMGARVLAGPRGRAVQQNLGAMAATGSVLLFLHADTQLPEHYVDHVFDILMDSKVAAGAFRFKTDLKGRFMRIIEFTTYLRSRYLNLPYGDQALFVRRNVFEVEGGFPEVPLGEDFYFVRRLSRKGRIKIAPVPVITSGRRWSELGKFRTSWLNQVVGAGLLLGISPHTLARLYRKPCSEQRIT